ncbi:MAG TPA: hypothetical protein VMT20_22640 [Terriglobia bacterium]|nr:hypothetical protein [Terriglobia bacterium]
MVSRRTWDACKAADGHGRIKCLAALIVTKGVGGSERHRWQRQRRGESGFHRFFAEVAAAQAVLSTRKRRV